MHREQKQRLDIDLERQERNLLRRLHSIAIVVYLFFFLFHYGVEKRAALALPELVAMAVLALSARALGRGAPLARSGMVMSTVVALEIGSGFLIAHDQPNAVAELYWSVLIPPLAFFLAGIRFGSIVAVVTLALILSTIGLVETTIPDGWLVDYAMLYACLFILGYYVEKRRRAGEQLYRQYQEVLRQSFSQAHEAAHVDPLTGVFNRRRIDEALAEWIQQRHTRMPYSLIFIDIDHFKAINDRFGHEVGDTVLSDLAHLIKNRLRDGDLFGRWGGEEFVIVAPRADAEGARILAERLRELVSCFPFLKEQQVTASFGVAVCNPDDTEASLLRRADQALYAAKGEGRNRVVVADLSQSTPVHPIADG